MKTLSDDVLVHIDLEPIATLLPPVLTEAPAPCELRRKEPQAVLVCVPAVESLEGPSSWISRLAFKQVENPSEVMKYLGMWVSTDPDLAFTQRVMRRAAAVCGLELKEFGFMRHMLSSLCSIGAPNGFLLKVDRFARYRFCKACLRAQRVKYFPLHWRFAGWRWCPEHNCLLEDRCPHCSAFVTLPAGLARAAENRRARGMLDQCMVCHKTLWAKASPRRFDALRKFPSPWERFLLQNGRAVLAALWTRSVLLHKGSVRQARPLLELIRLHKAGLLPHAPMRFDLNDRLPKLYRHPLNDEIVSDRPPLKRKEPWRGLFEGP